VALSTKSAFQSQRGIGNVAIFICTYNSVSLFCILFALFIFCKPTDNFGVGGDGRVLILADVGKAA
jgi:hypothetical protein